MVQLGEDDLNVNRCGCCGFTYLASWEQSLARSGEFYEYYGRLTEEDLKQRHTPENRARQERLLKELAGFTL